MSTEADHRLPRSVIPSHYDLRIEPDFTTFGFVGRFVVTAVAVERVAEIVLNAIEIDLDRVEVVAADGTSQQAALDYDPGRERVTLVLGRRSIPALSRFVSTTRERSTTTCRASIDRRTPTKPAPRR
mgnify:CR=1 FL=1